MWTACSETAVSVHAIAHGLLADRKCIIDEALSRCILYFWGLEIVYFRAFDANSDVSDDGNLVRWLQIFRKVSVCGRILGGLSSEKEETRKMESESQ